MEVTNIDKRILDGELLIYAREFIDQDRLQEMCDYSFGDHGGFLGAIPQCFMKKANMGNEEFVKGLEGRKKATLFIDNVRLYRRPIEYSDWLHMKPVSETDKRWLAQFEDEDLLDLCSRFPEVEFTIFTALEDVPLDESIRVPDNVRAIHACNAVYLNEKIHPWPHGLNRLFKDRYNHQVVLRWQMDRRTKPSRLLYVNHRDDTGDRKSIRKTFTVKSWATVSERANYPFYLAALDDHKFVLCPSGNGIDSARNWETLYLRRVPVLKDHPYLRELFKPFPALFVNDWDEVTEELLNANLDLFEKAQTMSMDNLDLAHLFAQRV